MTFLAKDYLSVFLNVALATMLALAAPTHAWVGGKVMESTMLPSEALSSSLSTRPAYSDMIDLTSCLGPKVEAFNKKCLNPSERIQLLAKAEFRNPASQSHKDRIARAMIVKAEERGELTDSYGNKKAIMAASSGNSGHALSKIGKEMGYRVIIITNNKCSQEKCDNIRHSGGELWMAEDLVTTFPNDLSDPSLNYMDQERILCKNYPEQYFSVNQYENIDNMMAHYEATGQEIWDQSQGRATHFVMAASTGGSIMGIGKFLKEQSDGKVRVILSDPHKSRLAGLLQKGRGNVKKGEEILRRVAEATKREGPIQVEGAGKEDFTKIMTYGNGILQYVDEAISIHDFDAFDMCRKIDKDIEIRVGGSAGMNVKACQDIAERLIDEGNANRAVLTTLLCDDGNKYKSKIYNDHWMRANDPRPKQKKVTSILQKTLRISGGASDKATAEVGYRMDPADWESYRSEMHGLLDTCTDRMTSYRDLPWKAPPASLKKTVKIETKGIEAREGRPLRDVISQLTDDIMPHATGNTHPQFMGWVHGAGIPSAVAADLVSSTMNSNCGGRNQGAAEVEVACIDWLCHVAGFAMNTAPSTPGRKATIPFGVLTGGTSQATIYALMSARTRKFGYEVRKKGILAMGPVRVYVSSAAHSCMSRAMECLGHGSDSVIRIPVDPETGAMQIEKLRERLEKDKAAGLVPLAIVGTAGSVTVGAYDDFASLSTLAKEYNTWLHIDAAFGFWTRLSQDSKIRSLTNSIHEADSIALDAHKWPGVQYDCGALLVRDKVHLRDTLASRPAYLQSASEGLAGGDTWFTDYSLDLSRGFRALKLWTALQVAGSDAIGAVVTDHCALALYMGELVKASPFFELTNPVHSNICCFHIKADLVEGNALPDVADIAAKLQLQGKGVFSTINLGDKACLRAAIVNHRTSPRDIAAVLTAAEESIQGLLSQQAQMNVLMEA